MLIGLAVGICVSMLAIYWSVRKALRVPPWRLLAGETSDASVTMTRARWKRRAAVSGIAGPDGGSSDKPVGMVWFAWVWRDRPVFSRVRRCGEEREAVRRKAVRKALAGMLGMLNRDAEG